MNTSIKTAISLASVTVALACAEAQVHSTTYDFNDASVTYSSLSVDPSLWTFDGAPQNSGCVKFGHLDYNGLDPSVDQRTADIKRCFGGWDGAYGKPQYHDDSALSFGFNVQSEVLAHFGEMTFDAKMMGARYWDTSNPDAWLDAPDFYQLTLWDSSGDMLWASATEAFVQDSAWNGYKVDLSAIELQTGSGGGYQFQFYAWGGDNTGSVHDASTTDRLGMDNIEFTHTCLKPGGPEPGTGLLGLIAAGLLLARRRR